MVALKKIDVGFKELKKIYHLADIHIRNIKRHDEYRKIFNKFFKNVKENGTEQAIIVIAGDLAHAKTEMSPELVNEIVDFLNQCTEFCPTFIITGNHDALLNCKNRLDVISPIIKALENDKIFYLKDSGLYKIADCIFSVMSILQDQSTYIKAADIKEIGLKIALFHGPLNRAKTDSGYVVSSNEMTARFFDGYDLVLLGDIHKAQTVQDFHCEEIEVEEELAGKYIAEGWELSK